MQETELFDYDPMVGVGFTDGARKIYSDQLSFLLSRAEQTRKQEATAQMAKELIPGDLDQYVSDKYKRQMSLTAHQDLGGRRSAPKKGGVISPCGLSVGSGTIGRHVFDPTLLTRSKRR